MNEAAASCCAKCSKPIDSAMRVHHRGAMYHVGCYDHEKANSPVCAWCKNPISDSVATVMHMGARYHRLCADTAKRNALLSLPVDIFNEKKQLRTPDPNALTPAEQAREYCRTGRCTHMRHAPLGTRDVLADEIDEDPPHLVDDIAFRLFATDPEFRKEFSARTEYTGDQTAAMREVWRKADDIVIRDGVAHARWPKLAAVRLAAYERARMMCALQVG